MNFPDSLSYLYLLGNEVSAMKLGLENIRTLLAALGDPQTGFLKVQVAGTNGKGSVCAFLDAMCISAGIKTGLYTSPHLISITERIKLQGRDIREGDFARHATTVRETAERLLAKGEIEYRPTFFEQVTAIALIAFAEAGVDLAILETGLGGRLDATTAANAEIAAITQIDFDHQEYLGETLAEIAAEKAAIIHEGSKVVIGKQTAADAAAVIEPRCGDFGIKAGLASRVRTTCGSGWLTFETDKGEYNIEKLGLLGRHQTENAKIAILLAETLQDHFTITTENIVTGLQNAHHPGRLEFHGQYLFDGAHNIAGARALAAFLDEVVTQPITLVFGAMRDKDIGGITEILFPKAAHVVLTRPDNSRAMTAEEMIRFLPDTIDRTRVVSTNTVSEALARSADLAGDNGLILVTGSLYLVGEAKKIL